MAKTADQGGVIVVTSADLKPNVTSATVHTQKTTSSEKWFLWISFAFLIYVQGLSSFTLSVYLNTAATLFNGLVQYSTISTVQAIINGVGNAAFARAADVFGRPHVLSGSIGFYIIGSIVMATANSIGALSAGMIFYSFGNTGITFSTNLVIADLVPAHWRCTITNLTLMPFIINFGVGPKITSALAAKHWRWGIGMFTIMVPLTSIPVAYCLYRMSNRAQLKAHSHSQFSFRRLARNLMDLDILGLLVLLIGFGLLLLPLTIANEAPKGYASAYIIVMFVLGGVALVAFPFVESWIAKPAFNLQRLSGLGGLSDVVIATAIAMADALSVMIAYTPSYNWVRITFDYSVQNATYYLYASSLGVVIFGILGGAVATYTRRYKWLTVFGGAVRLLALGLMYQYRGPNSSTAQIIVPQVIQGLGGALMTANLLVAAQIAVSHADVAMVTGIFLMSEGVADGAGSAIAGAIQQHLLPELKHSLHGIVNETVIETIYEQGVFALDPAYPLGSPVRTATIAAWTKNTRHVMTAAIVIAGFNLVLCFFLRDRKLPNTHNAVTDETTGLPLQIEEDSPKTQGHAEEEGIY